MGRRVRYLFENAVLPTNLFTDLFLVEIIGLFWDQTFVPAT